MAEQIPPADIERARKIAENARTDHNSPERFEKAKATSDKVNETFKKHGKK